MEPFCGCCGPQVRGERQSIGNAVGKAAKAATVSSKHGAEELMEVTTRQLQLQYVTSNAVPLLVQRLSRCLVMRMQERISRR